MIDDSALLHGRVYDPVKAREYYLRTRQLKGRRRPRVFDPNPNRVTKAEFEKAATGNEGTYDRPTKPPSLEEQKEALIKRLSRLREVLAKKVEAAKARSGVEVKSDPSDSPADKATRNEVAKKNTPLTETQKREKAEKAREEYKKENGGPSLSAEVQQLQKQVVEIQKQIAAAVAEARRKSSGPQNQTAPNGR